MYELFLVGCDYCKWKIQIPCVIPSTFLQLASVLTSADVNRHQTRHLSAQNPQGQLSWALMDPHPASRHRHAGFPSLREPVVTGCLGSSPERVGLVRPLLPNPVVGGSAQPNPTVYWITMNNWIFSFIYINYQDNLEVPETIGSKKEKKQCRFQAYLTDLIQLGPATEGTRASKVLFYHITKTIKLHITVQKFTIPSIWYSFVFRWFASIFKCNINIHKF